MTPSTLKFYDLSKEELYLLIEKAILNNYEKKYNYLYNLALSMMKNNDGKSICPFNNLYFQLSDKQEKFVSDVAGKVCYNESRSYLFLENGLKAKLSFYKPTTNKKTYISFIISK